MRLVITLVFGMTFVILLILGGAVYLTWKFAGGSKPAAGTPATPKKKFSWPGWTKVSVLVGFAMFLGCCKHCWTSYERGQVAALKKREELRELEKDPRHWLWLFKQSPVGQGSPEDVPNQFGSNTRVTGWATNESGLAFLEFWYENQNTGKRVTYTWRSESGSGVYEHEGRQHPFTLNVGSTADVISGTLSDTDDSGKEVKARFVLRRKNFLGAE